MSNPLKTKRKCYLFKEFYQNVSLWVLGSLPVGSTSPTCLARSQNKAKIVGKLKDELMENDANEKRWNEQPQEKVHKKEI